MLYKISALTTLIALASGRAVPLPGRTSNLKRVGPSFDIPMNDTRLVRDSARAVEQVHVNAGIDPTEAIIVWVTDATSLTSLSYYANGSSNMVKATGPAGERYSFLLDPSSYYPVNTTCAGSHNYTNPDCYYNSGEIHMVTLTGLTPATTYMFQITGDTALFSFSTGPDVGAQKVSFAIIGDLGQTENSSHTVENVNKAVQGKDVDMILLAGDLSYADGYGPRWDTYARGFEYLFANTKTAYVGGNHEVSSGGENWVNYKARYPNPHTESGSDSFLWYSFDQGPAHMIMMCSYAATGSTSQQYNWLKNDLSLIDRSKTPWVIAVWHTPWYTSNAHHPMSEGAEMKSDMESLLLSNEVDVVFNGHVHAYERTHPVANGVVDCQNGINYITIGDGGNREQFALPWTPDTPAWSALREFAYGHGQLHIENSTHALWEWHRDNDPWNPAPNTTIGDSTYFVRHSSVTAGGLHEFTRC